MLEDLKLLLTFFIMALISAIVRFKTFTQAAVDTLLGFSMGYIMFLMLDFTEFSGASKCGFACAAILWSRPLYDAVANFITKYLHRVVDKLLGVANDK